MSEDKIQQIISKAIVDEYAENWRKWNKIFGSAGGYHINFTISIVERLLTSSQFISVKELRERIEKRLALAKTEASKADSASHVRYWEELMITIRELEWVLAQLPQFQSEKEVKSE